LSVLTTWAFVICTSLSIFVDFCSNIIENPNVVIFVVDIIQSVVFDAILCNILNIIVFSLHNHFQNMLIDFVNESVNQVCFAVDIVVFDVIVNFLNEFTCTAAESENHIAK
jgi:hypothetical protein